MPSDEELSAFMATVPVLPIPDYLVPGYESREVDDACRHTLRCHICDTAPGGETTNARCQARGCELECVLCAFRP